MDGTCTSPFKITSFSYLLLCLHSNELNKEHANTFLDICFHSVPNVKLTLYTVG